MPRLRRAARERRMQPKLAIGVWEWLCGKAYEQLSMATRVDILVLEGPVVTARPSGTMNLQEFWGGIRRAVGAGEIELSQDVMHCIGDPPLLEHPDT